MPLSSKHACSQKISSNYIVIITKSIIGSFFKFLQCHSFINWIIYNAIWYIHLFNKKWVFALYLSVYCFNFGNGLFGTLIMLHYISANYILFGCLRIIFWISSPILSWREVAYLSTHSPSSSLPKKIIIEF